MREVIETAIRGLAADGLSSIEVLAAGIMYAPAGTPNVLEFNCRSCHPETQPILMRLNSDLTQLCQAALAGRLDREQVSWDPRPALGVVLAAAGYPDSSRKGDIEGLAPAARLPGKRFPAARLEGERVVTSGGRVLCAVGLGANVAAAQREAYALAQAVRFAGVQYRRDIGFRAIERELAAARP
jgi:phosphoribosylamine--glycine ligase